MATARFLGWLGAAAAVAVGATLIAGGEDKRPSRAASEPVRPPIVQPAAHTPVASTGTAPVERPAAPPDPVAVAQAGHVAQVRQIPAAPTPARIAEVEQAVVRLREAGGSDDDAYRTRALALSPEVAAQLAEMEAAERAWQHEQTQRGTGEAAAQPRLVTE